MKNKWILFFMMICTVVSVGSLSAGEPVTFSVAGDYPYNPNEVIIAAPEMKINP